MTPLEAVSILRRQREYYAGKLSAAARPGHASYHYLKPDERNHVQRQIEALDAAVVSLLLIDEGYIISSTQTENCDDR